MGFLCATRHDETSEHMNYTPISYALYLLVSLSILFVF